MRAPRSIRFFRALARDNRRRVERRRSLGRDALLYLANGLLRPADALLARIYEDRRFPIVFIVGAPRSGTTLLTQLLARHARVAWIDNRTARFWMAPLVAELVRRRRDFDPSSIPLRSHLGATSGERSPHEFTYFWRYWMGDPTADRLTQRELEAVAWRGLRRELYSLAGYHRQPLVMKNLGFVDFQVAALAEHLPNLRFLWVRRERAFVVQSILESRRRRYGDEAVWWSVRPPGWQAWRQRDPIEQVVYQVREVEHQLEEALAELEPKLWRSLRYEDLVAAPRPEVMRLAAFLGVEAREPERLAGLRLDSGNVRRLPAERFAKIEEALADG